jgi:hypothetical protein
MKLTANEKILGIETMRSRVQMHHDDRLKRGVLDQFRYDVYFQTQSWTRSQIVKAFRALPENQQSDNRGTYEYYVPTPRSDSEMQELIKNCGAALTLG